MQKARSGFHNSDGQRYEKLAKIDTQPLTPHQAAMSATAELATTQEILEPILRTVLGTRLQALQGKERK